MRHPDGVTEDEMHQADSTRDFLTKAFSHPAVTGVFTWGFWGGHHSRPEAAFLREDWSERPEGNVWRERVRASWWTDAEAATDAVGEAVLRGFLGDYEVACGGSAREASLPTGGEIVTLVLPGD